MKNAISYTHITGVESQKNREIISEHNSFFKELCQMHGVNFLQSFSDLSFDNVFEREHWDELEKYIKSSSVPINYLLISEWSNISTEVKVLVSVIKRLRKDYRIKIIYAGKPVDQKIILDVRIKSKTKKVNAVQYMRRVKDEQLEHTAIHYQKQVLDKYFDMHCYCAVKEIIDFSFNKYDDRPHFDNLLSFLDQNNTLIYNNSLPFWLAQENFITKLFIVRWDRLGSNYKEVTERIAKLREREVEVYAVEEPLNFAFPESKVMLMTYLNKLK